MFLTPFDIRYPPISVTGFTVFSGRLSAKAGFIRALSLRTISIYGNFLSSSRHELGSAPWSASSTSCRTLSWTVMCRARSASANEVAAKLTSTFRRRISSTECKSWVEHGRRRNEIISIYRLWTSMFCRQDSSWYWLNSFLRFYSPHVRAEYM